MKKMKLYAVILPWLCFQNFSFYYEHTMPGSGADSSTYIRVNSNFEQPLKVGRRH